MDWTAVLKEDLRTFLTGCKIMKGARNHDRSEIPPELEDMMAWIELLLKESNRHQNCSFHHYQSLPNLLQTYSLTMKPSTFTFPVYVALVRLVVGQTTPEQANDIAAKAYSDFVYTQLVGAGSIGEKQAIYFTPPNTIGVRAGLVVPPEVTNWDLYPFADNLQDPTETGAQFALTDTESYVDQLLT